MFFLYLIASDFCVILNIGVCILTRKFLPIVLVLRGFAGSIEMNSTYLSLQVMYRRILQQAGFIQFAQLQFLEAKELFR